MTRVDDLNRQVTSAILQAERFERLGDGRNKALAYLEVSRLEEALAHELAASELEGAIARRGAITAAMSAQAFDRARNVADVFLNEPSLPMDLAAQLEKLRAQADAAMHALGEGTVVPVPYVLKPAA
ncbi:MAG: hypothetical protein IT378_23935 [Sandaracinaceae bacterium]|nr:hypothetical protein [Sandaracinaceae bacterium]